MVLEVVASDNCSVLILPDCNFVQHDQFGSGAGMVWGGLSLEGRTDLHMLANRGLGTGMKSSEPLSDLTLVQDNALPHVARVCRQSLDDEGIDAIDWPSRSPDVNPIEIFWDIMDWCI